MGEILTPARIREAYFRKVREDAGRRIARSVAFWSQGEFRLVRQWRPQPWPSPRLTVCVVADEEVGIAGLFLWRPSGFRQELALMSPVAARPTGHELADHLDARFAEWTGRFFEDERGGWVDGEPA